MKLNVKVQTQNTQANRINCSESCTEDNLVSSKNSGEEVKKLTYENFHTHEKRFRLWLWKIIMIKVMEKFTSYHNLKH